MQPNQLHADVTPSVLDRNWRPIPGFENYICNTEGEVYNVTRKSYLRACASNPKSPNSVSYNLIGPGGRRRHISKPQLLKEVWPEYGTRLVIFINDVEYRQLPNYQDYYISEEGILVNHRYGNHVMSTEWHGDQETARISVEQIQITICINDILRQLWYGEDQL